MPNGIIIRDKNLIIKASLTGSRANKLLEGVKGDWDTITFEGEAKQPCFIISEAGVFVNQTSSWGCVESTSIYLIEGDYILLSK